MKVFAFHLQKGGVGKTTLSVSTAYELAESGYRTVLIDADPQGNSTSWLLEGRAEPEYELADVLTGDIAASTALCPVPDIKNLAVIPTLALTDSLRQLSSAGTLAGRPYALADVVATLAADAVVIDIGPGLGGLETAALIATTEVVLVMSPEYFSLDGLTTWANAVGHIEKNHRLSINRGRLVINGVNRTIAQMVEVSETAMKAARKVYMLGTDPVFRKAQSEHIPAQLYETAPMKSENRETLKKLVREVMK
jgi:chromosome partitioning protein